MESSKGTIHDPADVQASDFAATLIWWQTFSVHSIHRAGC